MTTDRTAEYLIGLVRELCKLPQETEWVEFKENVKGSGRSWGDCSLRGDCRAEADEIRSLVGGSYRGWNLTGT